MKNALYRRLAGDKWNESEWRWIDNKSNDTRMGDSNTRLCYFVFIAKS